MAMEKRYAQQSWTPMRRKWLDRLVKQLLHEVIADRHFVTSASATTVVREGSSNGRYCREFQQSITVGGEKEDAFGIAYQNPDDS